MKQNFLGKFAGSCRALALAAFAVIGAGASQAQTNFFNNAITVGATTIDLGNASGGARYANPTHKNWAIFALSGGVTITDPSLNTGTGSYDVYGNIGLAGGNLNISAGWVSGEVYRDTGAQSILTSGGAFTGPVTTSYGGSGPTGYLGTGVTNANSASTAAAGLTATGGTVATFVLTAGSVGNAALGLPALGAANTTYVLNLTNLILANSTLTLNGTNTTNFVFNVAQYMTLSNAGKILVSGGMQPQNVLYNVKSFTTQYDVTLSGGSVVNGIILAPTRNVKLTSSGGSNPGGVGTMANSTVYGEVIAKAVSLSGGSKVINPEVSP